nr:XrtA-associated tyrosine autokinase [Echinimonas agarilytica]
MKAKQKLAQQGQPESEAQTATATSASESSVVVPQGGQTETLQIQEQQLDELGMITTSASARRIRDEFRNIKLKLLTNAFGSGAASHKNGNLIMVSSANPNEGKTFTAINLALSIALEKDKTVLLVDADVLKPSVMNTFEIPPKKGLMEYLSGEVNSVADVIYPTTIDNLRVMPAGMPHDLSNELLTSEKMMVLAQELAERYTDRVVVFDCPPLIGINETQVLARLVGQVIVVVEQDKTKMSEVKDAIKDLDRDLAIGFVVNKMVRGAFSNSGYGYGYGYGYGHNESNAEKDKRS